MKAKLLLFRLRQFDVILGYLVTETTRAAVNGHDDLADPLYTHDTRSRLIVDVINDLYLAEMVARSQAARLLQAALQGGI